MKNIEKTMESISGTVFLYCSLEDEKSTSFQMRQNIQGGGCFAGRTAKL